MSVEKILVALAVSFIAMMVARWVFPERDSRYDWVGFLAMMALIVIVVTVALSAANLYPD